MPSRCIKLEYLFSVYSNNMFFVQLLGCVSCGGFIGEFYRTVNTSPEDALNLRLFIARFMAGSFLAFMVAYIVYVTSKQRELALIAGALLAYQDEAMLNKLTRNILREKLKGGEKHE